MCEQDPHIRTIEVLVTENDLDMRGRAFCRINLEVFV